MLNRYLGQLGQDRTAVKFLLNHYGIIEPGESERFTINQIMTTGSVQVPLPFQNGVIERVIFEQESVIFGLLEHSFRLWMFQDTITSAVRGATKAFTSNEMDSLVSYIDIRNGVDFPPPNDSWFWGEQSVPYANMLQKNVNVPFVINSEYPVLHIVQEYTGSVVRLGDSEIFCTLIIKRD
jgi:hypothetical protein